MKRHAHRLFTLSIESRQGHFSISFGDVTFSGIGGDALNVRLYDGPGKIDSSQRKLILTAFFKGLQHLKTTNAPSVSRVLHL
jgi:hypothetical protein